MSNISDVSIFSISTDTIYSNLIHLLIMSTKNHCASTDLVVTDNYGIISSLCNCRVSITDIFIEYFCFNMIVFAW